MTCRAWVAAEAEVFSSLSWSKEPGSKCKRLTLRTGRIIRHIIHLVFYRVYVIVEFVVMTVWMNDMKPESAGKDSGWGTAYYGNNEIKRTAVRKMRSDSSKAWRGALKRSGISTLRFNDLRYIWLRSRAKWRNYMTPCHKYGTRWERNLYQTSTWLLKVSNNIISILTTLAKWINLWAIVIFSG